MSLKEKFEKFAMSDKTGKILNKKIVKKGMVPLGNVVIKGTQKVSDFILGPVEKELKEEKEKGEKFKRENKEEQDALKGISKGRSTSDGYMKRG